MSNEHSSSVGAYLEMRKAIKRVYVLKQAIVKHVIRTSPDVLKDLHLHANSSHLGYNLDESYYLELTTKSEEERQAFIAGADKMYAEKPMSEDEMELFRLVCHIYTGYPRRRDPFEFRKAMLDHTTANYASGLGLPLNMLQTKTYNDEFAKGLIAMTKDITTGNEYLTFTRSKVRAARPLNEEKAKFSWSWPVMIAEQEGRTDYQLTPDKLSDIRRRELFDVSHRNPWMFWSKEVIYHGRNPLADVFDRRWGTLCAMAADDNGFIDPVTHARIMKPCLIEHREPFPSGIYSGNLAASLIAGTKNIRWATFNLGKLYYEGLKKAIESAKSMDCRTFMVIDSFSAFEKPDNRTSSYRHQINDAKRRRNAEGTDIHILTMGEAWVTKKLNKNPGGKMRTKKAKHRTTQVLREVVLKSVKYKNCHPVSISPTDLENVAAPNGIIELNIKFEGKKDE